MTEYQTLVRTEQQIRAEGKPCHYGCSYDDLPGMIAYAKQTFPDKPYCVLGSWLWVDMTASDSDMESGIGAGGNPSVIYAGKIIADEAQRPHVGPLIRTSPLCEFHRDCIFVTRNTTYILQGAGNRTTWSPSLLNGLISSKEDTHE